MIAGAVITDDAKGGTFLLWSLYYLSGRNDYYHAEDQKSLSLTENPVTNKNAHLFRPNQPNRLDEYTKIFNLLNTCNTQEFIYFHNFPFKSNLHLKKALGYNNYDPGLFLIFFIYTPVHHTLLVLFVCV